MTETQGLEISLGAAIMSLNTKLDREHEWELKHTDVVYQTPIFSQISGTSNSTDGNNTTNEQLQNDLGTCWSVRRLSVTGYTAGTVTLYINAIEPIASWTFGLVNPFYTYSKGAILLQPGDRLTMGSTGVTGTAQLFGVADVFPVWYLRKYLD